MKLRSAKPMEGARWMMTGVRLLLKYPLAHLACASVMSFALGLLLSLPWIGPVLVLALLPALSAGWALCSAAPERGQAPSPMLLLSPLIGPRRGVLLRLGLLYALGAMLMMWLADALDPDFRDQLATMMGGQADSSQALAVVAAVQEGILLRGLFFLPVALLFWHAPLVAVREGTGVAKALFSSAVASLRNLTALAVYGLCWLFADVVMSTVAGLLLGLLGMGSAALLVAMPLALLFLAAFYASLYASVGGCIEFDANPALPPAGTPGGFKN
jgi:hypothetical protein